MGDAHAIAEHREQRLLASHQVSLEQVLADGIAGDEFESFLNPCVLICHRFLLNENGPQLAIGGKGGNGGFINVFVVGAEPIEHLADKGGIDCGVEFVGFHRVK